MLGWLREELRQSLEQAHKALRRYLRESLNRAEGDIVDPAILRAARQALHQAAGALELAGNLRKPPRFRSVRGSLFPRATLILDLPTLRLDGGAEAVVPREIRVAPLGRLLATTLQNTTQIG